MVYTVSMKRVGLDGGYTIVEVLVFLAVSSLLLVAALITVGGQQARNQFNTGMRDIESQLRDAMNDVATGYYNSPGDFPCQTPSAGMPQFTGSNVPLGQNAQCIFVAKALHFAPGSDKERFDLYSMVGRRRAGTPAEDVKTLQESAPRVLNVAGADKELRLPNGIEIVRAQVGGTDIGAVILASRFSGDSGGGFVGSQDIDLIPITGMALGQAKSTLLLAIDGRAHTFSKNPTSGIRLCFNSGTTEQRGIILLGGSGRQVTTELTIEAGAC